MWDSQSFVEPRFHFGSGKVCSGKVCKDIFKDVRSHALMKEQYKPLQEELSRNPDTLRDLIRALHTAQWRLNDMFIDRILGLPPIGFRQKRPSLEMMERIANGKNEQLTYQGTQYEVIRQAICWARPGKDDVVYDLGCGYGRFCIYGALTTPASFRGIDIVPERIQRAEGVKQVFRIENAEFILGNVVDQDIKEGTVFYMFNPFAPSTLDEVMNKLRGIAQEKSIRIIAYSMMGKLTKVPWLQMRNVRFYDRDDLSIFVSRVKSEEIDL